MPTEMRRKRQRSIRVLLALIFIVPLASLLGLWGFAASVTLSNAIQEHNFNTEDQQYGGWAQTLFTQLAKEREAAFTYLSSGRRLPVDSYLAQQRATTKAVGMFQQGLATSSVSLTPTARPALRDFKKELASLSGAAGYPGIRAEVAAGKVSALTAFQDYNVIIDAEFRLYASVVVVNNTPLYMQAAASVEAGRAIEMASREATLVAGSFYASGHMSKAERVLFAQTAANRQLLMTDALRELDPSLGSGYQRVDASAAYKNFLAMESAVINSIGRKGRVPISGLQVAAATIPLFNAYQGAQKQNRIALSNMGTRVGNQLLEEVGLAGGAGLLAVAASVLLMVLLGGRITRDLTGLQRAALALADDRLPSVVTRLSQGEDVDIAQEAVPLEPGRIAETARLAEAFSSVHRTAVEAAVGQAKLRKGVSQVFRNLAWRSQSLLHRQLALLDAMERRETEPDALDELFQLDHLTTRMRRHAEGLIILSGHPPGRGWRDPVPMTDVLRGAVAEVEDYKRVAVICESHDAVIGSAVADVIHLLAELIENAATCSPASTEVRVQAERVANGFVVEIEDRGIGIAPAELTALNERLQNPPEFDLADSDQLGLFVAARLAAKYQIMITLRRSPYGGTTAIVLLPSAIMAISDQRAADALDVFGTKQPANGVRAQNGAATSRQLALLAPGRHAADVPPAESLSVLDVSVPELAPVADDHAASGNGWQERFSATGSVPPPGLPRRRRQASLAPQLRDDGRSAADREASDGPSPDGSRALAESLQHALDRARSADDESEDGSWPSDGAWPSDGSSPEQSWPAEGWQPAEPPELVGPLEEPEAP
ncbi:MAG TPA: nitrate- and nitrite sensing domain-containing protein [Streptosporangiaceae bacterium]|nr:nitrate- and nitrite sensing domain-containing protein [Streptosporangiaceae bacterium]